MNETYIDRQTLAVLCAIGNILFLCGVGVGNCIAPAVLRARRLRRIRKRRLARPQRHFQPILREL